MAANQNDITVVESESDDESQCSEEFNFAVALQLRKNLTETFDKHVHSSNISEKIAQFENHNASTRTAATAAGFNKPPRQKPNTAAAAPAAATTSKTTALDVYLRVRPIATGKEGAAAAGGTAATTLEIQPAAKKSGVPTTVRTFPPVDSNAAKVNRDSFSDQAGGVKDFDFTQVFGMDSSQQQVYRTVAAPLVTGLFPSSDDNNPTKHVGESALLFAYGITNAGKTHTIMGDVKNKESMGIIPRAFQDIFTHMEERDTKYDLHLSYMEIYNEAIYDLLPQERTERTLPGVKPKLKLREGRDGQTFVRGVAKHRVENVAHGLQLAQQASTRRHTSSNNINVESSRSHCICQLELIVRPPDVDAAAAAVGMAKNDDDASTNGYTTDDELAMKSSRRDKSVTLWIVDLAGSERSKRTGVIQGSARQKEAALINSSLMKLMRCLSVMRRNQSLSSSTAANVVPFRESKLTHLFMNHLTGPSANRTLMIVNVNPGVADFDETQHVLAYATSARMVQITQEEVNRKRKDMGAMGTAGDYLEATHDYNGRALKRFRSNREHAASAAPALTTTTYQPTNNNSSKIAKLVRRFSPKNLVSNKTIGAASTQVNGDAKKRKVVEGTKPSGSTKSHVAETGERKPKMAKLASVRAQVGGNHPKNDSSQQQLNASKEKELKQLKMALSIAQAETELLRSEKSQLEEQLSQQEAQVRMEIAQDMEEQMRVMREQYDSIIDNLKTQVQSAPTPAKSVKKAQKDKAETIVEELMDKVDECEDEMKRMRQAHEAEVTRIQKEHAKAIQAKDEQLLQLTSSHKVEVSKLEAITEDLRARLESLRDDHIKLEKSKKEMIESYEKLIREEEEEESTDEEEEEEELVPTSVQRGRQGKGTPRPPRSRTSKVAVQVLEPSGAVAMAASGKNSATRRLRTKRTPFSPVPINENPAGEDESDDSFGPEMWLRPKKPVEKDVSTGNFVRPRGRAPSGREWDENVGAWRLSIAG